MRYLVLLLALAFTLPACAQKLTKMPPRKIKVKTPAAVAPATAPEPVLVFQRTPCHGTCPTYTASVFADGRVEYDGQRFVALLGKHTLSLPVVTVAELLAEAKKIKFEKLNERYSGNTSDLPATIVTVHPVGQPAKAVYAEEGIPENLQAYIQYLKGKLDPLSDTKPLK